MRQRWLGGVLAAAVLVAMAMAGLSAPNAAERSA